MAGGSTPSGWTDLATPRPGSFGLLSHLRDGRCPYVVGPTDEIAYEILGNAADAEDVLQDSYLRWSAVDTETVENPRAYLAQIVPRQALNQMRGVRRRRDDYIGSRLPEPICTAPDVDEDTLLGRVSYMAGPGDTRTEHHGGTVDDGEFVVASGQATPLLE
ncbi:sigma factor [Rhodococcus sp. NPDC058521]|uniref:sigma factor n=1 Tax=Rhodococcus sp. NPDC058521 TaxID=3346536 RepID=UPI00365C27A1